EMIVGDLRNCMINDELTHLWTHKSWHAAPAGVHEACITGTDCPVEIDVLGAIPCPEMFVDPADVVIHDIVDHVETVIVRRVDETTQRLVSVDPPTSVVDEAIGLIYGDRIDTHVSPVASAFALIGWEELDSRHP